MSQAGPQRVVLIVDRGRDLGPALCRAFVARGDQVVLFSDETGADAIAGLDGARALPLPPARASAIRAAVANVVERTGRVDVMVSADKTSPHPQVAMEELAEQDWRDAFEANLHTPFFFAREAALAMRGQGGAIVLLSTSSASVNLRAQHLQVSPAYEAANAALERLSRRLALEFGAWGINVNCLAPGNVDKPGLRRWLELIATQRGVEPALVMGQVTERQVVKGFVPLEAVVAQVLHLAHPASRFITGQSLLLAGGLDL